jgi:hypothetical protein
MSSAVLPPAAPPPPAPFKDRRGWLTVFGIVEILIGCLIVLFMGFAVFAIRSVPQSASTPAPDSKALALMAVFYVIIALTFVIIGIGSIHARGWARMAMLIIGWIWLAIGFLMALMMIFLLPMILSNAQKQATTPMPQGFNTIMAVIIFVFVGSIFILLPLVFILFYSSKNVRMTCENASGDTLPGKPMAVWIASGWFAFGALGYIFVFIRPALPLVGLMLRGWAAAVAGLLMEALTIWLAWNLYRQRELAWKVAISWLIFGWLSLFATTARYGLGGMYRSMGYSEAELAQILPFTKYGIWIGATFGAAFLLFLLLTRKHYLPDTTSQPAS